MRDLGPLVRWWFAHRQVQRASWAVLAGVTTVLVTCGWRILADGSTIAADQLVVGHRYATVCLLGAAVAAAAIAGSVVSLDVAHGTSAAIATTSRRPRTDVLLQIVAAAVAACGWYAVVATASSIGVLALLSTVGGDPGSFGAAEAGAWLVLLLRLLATTGALALTSASLATVRPGTALAPTFPVLGVVVIEAVVLLASHGVVPLLPFGTYGVLADGAAAAERLGAPASAATPIALTAWVAVPLLALALAGSVARWRPQL